MEGTCPGHLGQVAWAPLCTFVIQLDVVLEGIVVPSWMPQARLRHSSLGVALSQHGCLLSTAGNPR